MIDSTAPQPIGNLNASPERYRLPSPPTAFSAS